LRIKTKFLCAQPADGGLAVLDLRRKHRLAAFRVEPLRNGEQPSLLPFCQPPP
jgi:hypothetical protein